ncbi:hypothetical protein Tco_1430059 [Tanacetum coccineum]
MSLASSSRSNSGNPMSQLLHRLRDHSNKQAKNDRLASNEYERYVTTDFIFHFLDEWWGEGDDVGAAGGCSGGVRRWLRRWKMMLVVLMIYGSVWRWRSIVVCRLSWPDVGGGAGSLAGKRRGAGNDI